MEPAPSRAAAALRRLTFLARRRGARRAALAALAVFFFVILPFHRLYLSPPARFPAGEIVPVSSGATLRDVSADFAARGLIRSPFWFEVFVILLAGDRGVRFGEYLFPEPRSVFSLARALAAGNSGIPAIRVTFPEGSSVREMAERFDGGFFAFDREAFLRTALPEEGYLFPDTYFFSANVRAEEVVSTMRATFARRLESVAGEIERFGRPLADVVTMASLLEEEARDLESRRIVAGILWRRLDAGMPLQVDAVFPYLIGKNTFELTADDLALDSPYNTYRYRGLPPGPITNPGLEAIRAAVTPRETPYFYYLTGRDGTMRYARTFAEHVRNKELYLK